MDGQFGSSLCFSRGGGVVITIVCMDKILHHWKVIYPSIFWCRIHPNWCRILKASNRGAMRSDSIPARGRASAINSAGSKTLRPANSQRSLYFPLFVVSNNTFWPKKGEFPLAEVMFIRKYGEPWCMLKLDRSCTFKGDGSLVFLPRGRSYFYSQASG